MTVKNGVLNINKITDSDENTYICVGKNSYIIFGKQYSNDIQIERKLRIKSWFLKRIKLKF